MILHKNWGETIRLGNWLFKYASLLGISKKHNESLYLPVHYMFDYFNLSPNIDDGYSFDCELYEPTMKYNQSYYDEIITKNKNKIINCNLSTFLQSPKYWEDFKFFVHEHLKFNNFFVDEIKNKYEKIFKKDTIGVSIRRGDYVGHPQFHQLDPSFYLYSLEKYFPNWEKYNIVFFCDDSEWVRSNFKGDNIFYADGNFVGSDYWMNPMEQLILGSLCKNFIISNSTFSWWLSYYAVNINNPSGLVIHSGKYTTLDSDTSDYYHNSWICSDFFDNENKELKTIKKIYYGN